MRTEIRRFWVEFLTSLVLVTGGVAVAMVVVSVIVTILMKAVSLVGHLL